MHTNIQTPFYDNLTKISETKPTYKKKSILSCLFQVNIYPKQVNKQTNKQNENEKKKRIKKKDQARKKISKKKKFFS